MAEGTDASKSAGARALYLLAALPFVFLWLLSHGHAGGLFFLAPSLLCIVQALRPKRALWAVLFWVYFVLAGIYAVALLADVLTLAGGGTPRILLDFDDSVVFLLLELFLGGVTFALYKIQPPKLDDSSENPFANPPEGGGAV